MGNEHIPWSLRFLGLITGAAGRTKPIKVEPKQTRTSGPVETPSDWYDSTKQQFLGPQCQGCHQNMPVGARLNKGLCGLCAPMPQRPADEDEDDVA